MFYSFINYKIFYFYFIVNTVMLSSSINIFTQAKPKIDFVKKRKKKSTTNRNVLRTNIALKVKKSKS